MKKPLMKDIQSIIDSFPLPYQSMDAKASIIHANKAWLDLLGYSRKEVINKWFGDFLTPDSANLLKKRFPIFITEGKVRGIEYTLIGKEGREMIVSFDGNIEFDEKNRVKRSHCFFKDITEQKQINQSLQENEERWRALLTSSPDTILMLDDELRIEFSNQASPGLSIEELIGKHIYDFVTEDKKSEIKGILEKVLKTGEPDTYETQYSPPDGSTIFYETKAVQRTIDENVIGLTLNSRDITERKQTEQALRESEEKYRTMFESMTQGVVYQDVDGKIISANLAAERVLGLTLDQLQGRTSVDPSWKAIHEDGSVFLGETHPSMVALTTGKVVENVVMGVFHPKKNTHSWININAIPQFKIGEKIPYQVFTTFKDITERKKLEENQKKNEKRYRELFDNSPIAIWEQDYSEVYSYFDELENNGVKDFNQYLTENPDELFKCAGMIKVKDVNDEAVRLYKAKSKKDLKNSIGDVFTEETLPVFKKSLLAIASHKKSFQSEVVLQTLKNEKLFTILKWSVVGDRVITTTQDITERKRVEDDIRSLSKFPDENPNPILRFSKEGKILYASNSSIGLVNKWGRSAGESAPPDWKKSISNSFASGEILEIENNIEDRTFSFILTPIKEMDYINAYGNDITERNRAKKELLNSEKKYRQIIETAEEGVWILDKNDLTEFVNQKMADLFGYRVEEFIGKSPLDFTDEQGKKVIRRHLRKRHQGDRDQYENKYIRKDGSDLWMIVTANPFYDEGGKYAGSLGMMTDITKQKSTHENLVQNENRYRELFNNIYSGVAVYEAVENGRDFIFTDYNVAAEKIDRIPRGKVIGRKVTEVFPGIRDMRLLETFQRVWKTGKPDHHPATIYRDDRLVGWRENYVYKLPTDEIVVVYEDITERVQARDQLQKSEAKLRGFMESANDGFAILDSELNFIDCNNIGARIIGFKDKNDLIGKNAAEISPDIRSSGRREKYLNVIKTGEPLEIEDLVPHPTLGDIHLSLKAFKVQEGLGIILRDITKERETTKEIESLLELSKKVSSESLENLVKLLANEIVSLIPAAEASSIWFYEQEKEIFIPVAWDGFKDKDMKNETIQKDFGLTGLVRRSMKPKIINNVPKSKYYKYFDNPNINITKSVLCTPLFFKGNFFGVIYADNLTKTDAFTERDLSLLESIANQLAGVIQNAHHFDEILKNQQDLQFLSSRLVEVHEEERKKIALDLHDQIGQMLTSLKLSINPQRLSRESEDNLNKQLKSAMQSIDEIIDIAEDLSLDLHPSILDDLGIVPAVMWHAGRYEEQTSIPVNLVTYLKAGVRYAGDIEISIFRILQEALTNTARHSDTKKWLLR